MLSVSPLHAQVLRCVDAQGHVTYTNSGDECATQKSVTEILPEPTPQERAQHEAQYHQALERKRQEQQLQTERIQAQQQADAQRKAAQEANKPLHPPVDTTPPPPAAEPSVVYVPAFPPNFRPPRPKPPQQHNPSPANCNVFRCYDGKGNTWPAPH